MRSLGRPPHWSWPCLALLVALALAGCGGGGGGPSGEPTPPPTPSQIRLALDRPIPTLDPAFIEDITSGFVARQIFDGLVEFEKGTSTIVPALATSWTYDEATLTYRFTLRQGVRFQDDPLFPEGRGRLVTADDVVFSLTRLGDPDVRSKGYWLFLDKVAGFADYYNGKASGVAGIRAPNASTVEIQLTQHFAPFLNLLCMSYAYIVPPEAVKSYGEHFATHPVGTGPYRLVSWDPELGVTLVRNPAYWEKTDEGRPLPHIEEVSFRFIRSSVERLAEFEAGRLDDIIVDPAFRSAVFSKTAAEGVPRLTPRMIQRGVKVAKAERSGALFLVVAAENSSFGKIFYKNRALREALTRAVDRDQLIREILSGNGVPADRIIPKGMDPGGTPPVTYPFDLAAAKRLLTQAGYPGGRGLEPIQLLTSSGRANDVSEFIAAQWRQLGLDVQVTAVPWSERSAAEESGRYDLFFIGWVADYPDPENLLRLFYDKAIIGIQYDNSDFRRLFETSLFELDADRRMTLYRQAEALILKDLPCVLLYHEGSDEHLQQPWVEGLVFNPTGEFFLKYAWINQQRRGQ